MLTVFDGENGYPLSNDDYYVRELASGLDELVFQMSLRDPMYKHIVEEARIRDRDENIYIIKQIDAGNEQVKVVAQIDIDDFKSVMYEKYSNNILSFNNSRDAFGTAMYKLGLDVNTTDHAVWDRAAEELLAQNPILKGRVMDEIYNMMESGEAAIGAYYAGDYFTMLDAQDLLNATEADAAEGPQMGDIATNGKAVAYGKRTKRKQHFTPDTMPTQRTIFEDFDRNADKADVEDWEGEHRCDSSDSPDKEPVRPFDQEW